MDYSKLGLEMESDEVFYSQKKVFVLTQDMLDFLVKKAELNPTKKVRLCTHSSHADLLHEMIIVHFMGNYVVPHKHSNKKESFHIMVGKLAIVIFTDDGKIEDIIILDSDLGSKYYRLLNNVYHTVVILSEYVVFHEITNGPFIKNDMIIPEWVPIGGNSEIVSFQKSINEKINYRLGL